MRLEMLVQDIQLILRINHLGNKVVIHCNGNNGKRKTASNNALNDRL